MLVTLQRRNFAILTLSNQTKVQLRKNEPYEISAQEWSLQPAALKALFDVQDSELLRSNLVGVQAHLAAPQAAIAAATNTAVVWTSIDNDPLDIATQGSANLVIPESGLWDVFVQTTWDSALGNKGVFLFVDGVSNDDGIMGPAQAFHNFTALDVELEEGEVLTVMVQTSSGPRALNKARLSLRRSGNPFG